MAKYKDMRYPEKIHNSKPTYTTKFQHSGRQYVIKVPAEVIRLMKIKKGDPIIFQVDLKKDSKRNKLTIRLGDK